MANVQDISQDDVQRLISIVQSVARPGAGDLGMPMGAPGIIGTIFSDTTKLVSWLTGLAGKFCQAYKTGGQVDGKQVSIRDVLQHILDVVPTTGPDGKAIAAAISLAIKALDDVCG